jgi:hypothetical protein
MTYTISCLLIGEATRFSVELDETSTVDELKDAIKSEIGGSLPAHHLTLYRVDIDTPTDEAVEQAMQQTYLHASSAIPTSKHSRPHAERAHQHDV